MILTGTLFWPSDMHEPLILGIRLPLPSSKPWLSWQSLDILAMERELCEVWESQQALAGSLLHKLYQPSWSSPSL